MDDKHEQLTPETAADIAGADAAAEPPCEPADEVTELRALLMQCRRELDESRDAKLRAQADFDNFRKRMRAERDQEFARGSERVLADLLSLIDDFERALASVNETSTTDTLAAGIELIYRHAMRLLERYQVTPMEVEGKPFDPKYHDAISRMATDTAPEHTIIGQIQRGYLKNGDVFRPAKVVVAVPMESEEE